METQRPGGRRKNQLLRARPSTDEVEAELKYKMVRALQVQQEVTHSMATMVEALSKSRRRSAFAAGIGILEEYISSIVQCGEDADELVEEAQKPEPRLKRAAPQKDDKS